MRDEDAVQDAAHAEEPKPAPRLATGYGQHLLNQALAENPGVIIMMMHVTPPGSKDNVVIASNIGRYGKKAEDYRNGPFVAWGGISRDRAAEYARAPARHTAKVH